MIRWLALYLLLGILIWRQESHAARTDQRQAQLGAQWQHMEGSLATVSHNTNPSHPKNAYDLITMKPCPCCSVCQQIVRER